MALSKIFFGLNLCLSLLLAPPYNPGSAATLQSALRAHNYGSREAALHNRVVGVAVTKEKCYFNS
jgi:hypothetical protein